MRPSLFYSHHKVWNGWVLSGILLIYLHIFQLKNRRLCAGTAENNGQTADAVSEIYGKMNWQILSMSPVIGNVCYLMSRNCSRLIESRILWDCLSPLVDFNLVSRELNF